MENRSSAERTRTVDKMEDEAKRLLEGKHHYGLYPHGTKVP